MTTHLRVSAEPVKAKACALGFDACAVASAGCVDPEDRLGVWLGQGYHADMAWMARTKALRQDVREKLPEAQSVVVVARNYYLPRPPQPRGAGRVARYAWGRDYHKVLKKPLRKLAAFVDSLEDGAESFIGVDSGPIMERSWAEKAGLAWIGKNSLALRRDLGSWFFLGAVVTTVPLEADDSPMPEYCGSCTACIDACPTDAIVADQVVDANRCISYQTIENRGDIPEALHGQMEDWIFGCDICQDVCPWNRFGTPTDEADFSPRAGVAHPDLQELVRMDEETFNRRFEGTPIRRAKHAGMQRNASIALNNGAAGGGDEAR